jgi:hypothetical protein
MHPNRFLAFVLLSVLPLAACDLPISTAPDVELAPAGVEAALIVPVSMSRTPAVSFSRNTHPQGTWSATPVVIDFESLATSLTIAPVGTSYSEKGYTLTSTQDAVFSTWGSSSPHYAGSAGLFLNNLLDLDVILTRDNGTLFSAQSIDLAPMLAGRPGVVTFVGTRSDGTNVTQTHTTGAEAVFTPYALEGFTSLVELRWTQMFTGWQLHQFDDIVLADAQAESRDDCFEGGWQRYGFRNQGECLRILEAGKR